MGNILYANLWLKLLPQPLTARFSIRNIYERLMPSSLRSRCVRSLYPNQSVALADDLQLRPLRFTFQIGLKDARRFCSPLHVLWSSERRALNTSIRARAPAFLIRAYFSRTSTPRASSFSAYISIETTHFQYSAPHGFPPWLASATDQRS